MQPTTVPLEEDSDEEIVIIVAGKDRRRILKIENYVETVIVDYNAEDFRKAFRISKDAFNFLISQLEWPEWRLGRIPIPKDKQLLSFLWLMATQDSYR